MFVLMEGLRMQGFRVFKTVPFARSIGILVVIFCSLFLRATAGAQDAGAAAPDQSQQAPPVLTVTTHEVLLDVVVTDAGRPVTGLKLSDFTVLEDGKPQVVASLEEHRPMAAAMTARAARPLRYHRTRSPITRQWRTPMRIR